MLNKKKIIKEILDVMNYVIKYKNSLKNPTEKQYEFLWDVFWDLDKITFDIEESKHSNELPEALMEKFKEHLIKSLYSTYSNMADVFIKDSESIRSVIHSYYAEYCRNIDFAKFVRSF